MVFPNIICLKTEKNSGTYVAKNLGLTKASGQYVTFQDCDDISHPSRIENQAKILLKSPEIVATSCHYCRIDALSGKLVLNRGERSRCGLISLMIDWPSVKSTIGFFDSVRVNADDEFKTRIRRFYGNKGVKELSDCLYFALLRKDSLTVSGHTANNIGTSDMRFFLAPVRQQYTVSFKSWHEFVTNDNLYVEFPGNDRPFSAPFSIDPFCSMRLRNNTLVVTSGLNNALKEALVLRHGFFARFFTKIICLENEDFKEKKEVYIQNQNIGADITRSIQMIQFSSINNIDLLIKTIIDEAKGGALLIIDSVNELLNLDDNWLRCALYKMISSRPHSKLIVCGISGAIYAPIEVIDVSRTKFFSVSNNIKHACALALVQNGVELVVN